MSNTTLGDQVEKAMQSAGIKPRTFAALVGCHFATIYDLLREREKVIPIRLTQEKIYDVIDFIDSAVKAGSLPLPEKKLTLSQKTRQIKELFKSYKPTAPVLNQD